VSLAHTDAWIFDLDGVLTDTASLHERAWSELFNGVFQTWSEKHGAPSPRPFTSGDYQRLVDGEARMDGVRNVLADRKIPLPEGGPQDPPGTLSVTALAREKDSRYLALLEHEGPRPFPSSVELLHHLRSAGVDIAVVSASRHCGQVLELAGLSALVDLRVDGETAAAMGLAGKPDPALFLEAARRLGVDPSRAVVVEDALAGVEAGRRGAFRIVIGVDRSSQGDALRSHGADLVVEDLGALNLEEPGPAQSPWRLTYEDPSTAEEGVVETLCTLGNGYLGTRGARPWATDDGTSYPGSYLAGCYNRLQSHVGSDDIEQESLVNIPNGLAVTFRAEDGAWVGTEEVHCGAHRVRLDLRRGLLVRRAVVRDSAGRETAVVERRIVSMAEPHLLALEVSCTPLNWSGRLEFRTTLDGGVLDDETVEERLLANRHLELLEQGSDEAGGLRLRVRTVQSQVTIALAARHQLSGIAPSAPWVPGTAPGAPHVQRVVHTSVGARTTLEKVVSVFTSKDRAISEPMLAATQAVGDASSFAALLTAQQVAWEALWQRASVEVRDEDGSSRTLNLHLFHLLQVASPHVVELDAGLGARGLHGEGYQGHVFWDTLFAFPVLNLRFPGVARALMTYRSRRLPEAVRAAARSGFRGAMFPWQSGSDGRDETPLFLFNPRSGRWFPDRSRFERHIGLAIAYEAWQHWQVTGDREFLRGPAAELLFETARFFASLATWDSTLGRYHIAGVVGPDEFHDSYPWSSEPGIADNAYTNVMTSWLLSRAGELAELLAGEDRSETAQRIGLDAAEIAAWEVISRSLHIPFHDGVISQFAGYEKLEPIDLAEYRERYGNIGRLDLILEAEQDAVCRYQVSKQADVLMLLYLLSAEELRAVFTHMGYALEPDMIRRTVEYYAARVTHGSTLSRVVHAWVLARADRQASWQYFQDALAADVTDSQAGTTREGVHLGAMAGTVDILQRCYAGLEVRREALWLHPLLPPELAGLRFTVCFRGHDITVDVNHERLRVHSAQSHVRPPALMVSGAPVLVQPGEVLEIPLRGDSQGETAGAAQRSQPS
jgi:HAD superfamily hydrolase (TIGR01509 family)